MTKRFKRIAAGLHRAEVDGQVFELQNERGHGWTLARLDSEAREGHPIVETCIQTLPIAEDALDFVLRVETYMKEVGAEHSPYYEWKLETKLGTLLLSVWGDAVMCRFEDVEKAKAHFGTHSSQINTYSGKWNHHLDGEPESMCEYFKAQLNPLLKD